MNDYEAKQEARRERYQELADKARGEAQAQFERAEAIGQAIPFGQPILVGHHSEGRARRDAKRIDMAMQHSIKATEKAAYYEGKAASVGSGGISGDDPEAIEKLMAKVAKARKEQELHKAINATIRKNKNKSEEEQIEALSALGFGKTAAKRLITPEAGYGVGIPSYILTNNNANIRRLERRIKELQAVRETAKDVEIKGNGYIFREDSGENRFMFLFNGRPVESVRAVLKSNAFKWSPTRGAWVRQITHNARWAAQNVKAKLDEMAREGQEVSL